jgi:hypothetical protein
MTFGAQGRASGPPVIKRVRIALYPDKFAVFYMAENRAPGFGRAAAVAKGRYYCFFTVSYQFFTYINPRSALQNQYNTRSLSTINLVSAGFR